MVQASPRPLIFDAGALIALERRDPRILQLVEDAKVGGRTVLVPATVLAQVWRGGRHRQVPLSLFLNRSPDRGVEIVALGEPEAKAVGRLCMESGQDDITDGHVVYLSLLHGKAPVLTSDPDDIGAFSAAMPIVRV